MIKIINYNEVGKQRTNSIDVGNKKVALELLDIYTSYWKGGLEQENKKFSPYDTLELIISPECNLKCKYCYIHRHNKELYPLEIRDNKTILENATKLIDWLIKNDYRPKLDIFTGEAFCQQICFDVFEMIINKYEKVDSEKRPPEITIPTNFSFIVSGEITKKVETLLHRFIDIGITPFLSASIEGKYMEQNRPFKHDLDIKVMGDTDKRDDAYYDRVFAFCRKWHCGLHPMVYSHDIHLWKDNFLWFQEMFEKHDMNWTNLMLLQVRNEEWTVEQIVDYRSFVEWCMEWTYNKCLTSGINFAKAVSEKGDYSEHFFCLLTQGLGSSERGLSCNIQSCVAVRLGDMSWVPCHRTMYPGMEYAKFKFDNKGNMIDIIPNKVELLSTIMAVTSKAMYGCAQCHFNELCIGQCLGSCYESLGSLFTPIPTVCSMIQEGLIGLARTWIRLGIFEEVIYSCSNPGQQAQWKLLKEMIDNGELK